MAYQGIPGTGSTSSEVTANIYAFGTDSQIGVLRRNAVVVSTAADAGSTPTTVLRPGMILGTVDASGKLSQYNPDATDGSQNIAGVLENEVDTLNEYATAEDTAIRLPFRAPLRASALLIEGTALVGHVAEFLTRAKLAAMGCVLDDDVEGFLAGVNWRVATKITDYTVVEADNATEFHTTTADTTYTLPTINAGLKYRFIMAADFQMVVASAAGDDMLVGNDLAADSVTFTTASEQIGAIVEVEAVYLAGTLTWKVTLPRAPFGTGGTGAMTISIAT